MNNIFDKIIERQNTASFKWGFNKVVFGTDDILPMWIADMDFEPPKEVTTEMQKRLEHGIYGYTYVPSSTSKAIKNWLFKRHDWEINQSWIAYSSGVVPTISTAIQAFTEPGDYVMLQTPIYTPFMEMIEKNNRKILNSQLKLVNNRYEMDFDDFEKKLQSGVKLFLLCSPHNPGGRVWTKEELVKIGDLCLEYNCLILSDEIHSDLVFKPNHHLPIASLNEKYLDITLTCVAPSKTFNIAGLQASACIIANKDVKNKFTEAQRAQGFHTLNTFGVIGMEAAYLYGESWLEELLAYLKRSITIAKDYIEKNIPAIKVIEPEATYLLWLDCRNLKLSDEELNKALIEKGKLGLQVGSLFGKGGEGFIRMNIGCSHEVLLDGLERLKHALS
ncbi:MalY/PatB family protein [Bacillus sp. 03113]|uniref:MalY/PatB family protein n=1 Tax=Bacillus sp. 03113 TaxID=2578211 RepID=UPI00114278EC|nr:MalY/PatB family protein [Bacillus sp. 03113]